MGTLLAIDIGNTRTKWGVHSAQIWNERGVTETVRLTGFAAQLLEYKNINKINKIVVSSVAEKNITDAFVFQLQQFGVEVRLVRAREKQCGVINHYNAPEQLGADRWCALIAAHGFHKGHAVVVMAGTAMTVDALTADGNFLGGDIVPGISLMQDALRNRTANLRAESGAYSPFPVRTQDAIHSGIISASVGAITQMRGAMKSAGYDDAACVISGGAAEMLLPHIRQPVMRVDNLVLDGILQIANSEMTESS